MPYAVHQLALHVLPADPDAPAERVATLFTRLGTEGFLDGDGPGPRTLVAGGFARARLDLSDPVRFVSNWQGGFSVRCPVTGENVVPAFGRALERWRAGGPRALACPCGLTHDLAALAYAPPAAFGRGAIVLLDAQDTDLHPDALALAGEVLGGARVVLRRG